MSSYMQCRQYAFNKLLTSGYPVSIELTDVNVVHINSLLLQWYDVFMEFSFILCNHFYWIKTTVQFSRSVNDFILLL